VVVEVIARQVREDRRRKPGTVDTLEGERVRDTSMAHAPQPASTISRSIS